ncbi:MAG: hypothetical protein O3A80_05285 [bacterium]|nr:hypothetical protein [bacterium]
MTNILPPEEDRILTWSAPEHMHHMRTRIWYFIACALVAFCIVYSVMTEAWSFTGLIVVLTILYWKIHRQELDHCEIQLWRNGFAMNGVFSEWGECEGYWILKCHDYYELHIEKRNGDCVKIQTGDVDPYQLHDLLPHFLPQLADRREKVLDTIIRICKL